jgi:hypothetical protein
VLNLPLPRVGRAVLVMAAGMMLTACSPMVRIELRFIAAPTFVLDPARFTVTGVKTCPPGPILPAKAGTGIGQAESFRVTAEGAHVLTVETRFRGKSCRVQVAGFYDVDGSGNVSPGDLVGTSVPLDGQDRGIFGGNLTRGPDVTLAAIPKSAESSQTAAP